MYFQDPSSYIESVACRRAALRNEWAEIEGFDGPLSALEGARAVRAPQFNWRQLKSACTRMLRSVEKVNFIMR